MLALVLYWGRGKAHGTPKSWGLKCTQKLSISEKGVHPHSMQVSARDIVWVINVFGT